MMKLPFGPFFLLISTGARLGVGIGIHVAYL